MILRRLRHRWSSEVIQLFTYRHWRYTRSSQTFCRFFDRHFIIIEEILFSNASCSSWYKSHARFNLCDVHPNKGFTYLVPPASYHELEKTSYIQHLHWLWVSYFPYTFLNSPTFSRFVIYFPFTTTWKILNRFSQMRGWVIPDMVKTPQPRKDPPYYRALIKNQHIFFS